MSDVRVIIVGIGQWEEYTKPLIRSIKKYEPDVDIIVVNNGTRYTSGQLADEGVFQVTVWEGDDINTPVSYANAINEGIESMKYVEPFKWLIILNNDVLCTGKFVDKILNFNENCLYGNKIHKELQYFDIPTFTIDGWIYTLPRKIFDLVGYFDGNFENAFLEDADYCMRAHDRGFRIKESNLPFKHLEYHIRKKFNFNEARKHNLKYIVNKHKLKPKGKFKKWI